ncbi:MAG: hypothetical protein ABI867_36410 [Kofleriaceae bacterium]
MTADELCEWLRDGRTSQREKLDAIDTHIAAIRALHDDDHARVIRELKKRLKSPKLDGELAALVALLVDRPANPRVQPGVPKPRPAMSIIEGDQRSQLEAAILADPTTRDSYIVLGDWLEAHGDPQGALVTIGQELAKNPGHKAMLAAHAAHLKAHAAAILGPLAGCAAVSQLDWFMGFIKSARVSQRASPPVPTVEAILDWLLDEPGPGRFLQDLTIGLVGGASKYDAATAALARRRRALRTLFIGEFAQEECELNWTDLGDLTPLWPMVPELRELTLRGGTMAIGSIDLPKLETLTTITGGLPHDSLAAIAAASWPALHTLSLHVGMQSEGAAGDVSVLAPLLAGDRVPKLRTLGIVNCEFVDELLVLLAESPLLPRLEALDVSLGTMSDAGVQTLLQHADRFAHLRVNVEDNYLPADAHDRLSERIQHVHFGAQRVTWNGARYASMCE